jgi:hypothetical protein
MAICARRRRTGNRRVDMTNQRGVRVLHTRLTWCWQHFPRLGSAEVCRQAVGLGSLEESALGSGPKTHPLGGNERIGYGPHSEIFSSYGSEAESTICVVRAGSVPEHSSHSVRTVLFRRSILSALRHHTITVQRLANTPGLWDGWTLPERNIGTDGDGDARDVAAARSHGKGRVGSARTCGG